MGWLSKLFSKGEEPVANFTDPALGFMKWSEDDEAWSGECNGIKYLLSFERISSVPVKELIDYAVGFLSDPTWVLASLEQAKQEAIEEFDDGNYEEEIKSLMIDEVHFYLYKNRRRIIAGLDGGRDFRAWKIEYEEKTCEGIGFDS